MNRAVKLAPRDLRAAAQAGLGEQQQHCLQEDAEVGPLGWAASLRREQEQARRRTPELIVAVDVVLPETVGRLMRRKHEEYGSTAVSIYEYE